MTWSLELTDESAAPVGVLGGRSTYPAPSLTRRCVCCDVATGDAFALDPSFGSEQSAGQLRIPLCAACADHVPHSNLLDVAVSTGLGLGAVVLALGLFYLAIQPRDAWVILRVGAGLALVSAAPWAARHARVRSLAARGHHGRFSLTVGPGKCWIRTNNPRLRDELLAAHGERIRLARK
ncbi:MAG: hypothetical protein FJ102_06420 [Deltaproteobacteria bacterium]|nr:hypothetical protein [Deltaproteobacteria bacterium]